MGFRDNVLQILEKESISQSDLAEKLGKSRQNISVILKKDSPSYQTVKDFADALGVQPTDLVNAKPTYTESSKQRFFQVIEYLIEMGDIKSYLEFCLENDLDLSALMRLKDQIGVGLPLRYVSCLAEYGASIEYIVTGQGDWIKKDTPPIIKETARLFNNDEIDTSVIQTNESTQFRNVDGQSYLTIMPRIDIFEYEDYLLKWTDQKYLNQLPKHVSCFPWIHLGHYRAFSVPDSRMDDGSKKSISQGDLIIGKRDDKKLLLKSISILANPIFVFHLESEIFVAKVTEIKGGNEINCTFLNKDKSMFPDRTINLDEVLEIFHFENLETRFPEK